MQTNDQINNFRFLFFTSFLQAEEDEIIVLEKKITNLSGWSESINDINKLF